MDLKKVAARIASRTAGDDSPESLLSDYTSFLDDYFEGKVESVARAMMDKLAEKQTWNYKTCENHIRSMLRPMAELELQAKFLSSRPKA